MWRFAKRYRFLILSVLVACLVLSRTGLFSFIGLGGVRTGQDKCDRIQPGMTLQQVEDILGPPSKDWGDGVSTWSFPDGIIMVSFDEKTHRVKETKFLPLRLQPLGPRWRPI